MRYVLVLVAALVALTVVSLASEHRLTPAPPIKIDSAPPLAWDAQVAGWHQHEKDVADAKEWAQLRTKLAALYTQRDLVVKTDGPASSDVKGITTEIKGVERSIKKIGPPKVSMQGMECTPGCSIGHCECKAGACPTCGGLLPTTQF